MESILSHEPSNARHAVVAIDMHLGSDATGAILRSQRSWIFSLNHPKAIEEIDACIDEFALELCASGRHWLGHSHARMCILRARHLVSGATTLVSGATTLIRDPLAPLPVSFAALSAWGCGPWTGMRRLGFHPPLDHVLLDAELQRWIIEQELDSSGAASFLTPPLRL